MVVAQTLDRNYTEMYYDVSVQRVAKGVYELQCVRSELSQIYRGDVRSLKTALREHFARHVEDSNCQLPNSPDDDDLF